MKYVILVSLVFLMSTALWAQGEGGNTCEVWEQVVNDNTCNSGGCASPQFTAPNCPSFYLSCGIVGPCASIDNCKVTATLYTYPGNVWVATCQNWSQDPPACGGGWASNGVSLTPGAGYKLEVCFDACPSHACSDCNQCQARGRVSVQQP